MSKKKKQKRVPVKMRMRDWAVLLAPCLMLALGTYSLVYDATLSPQAKYEAWVRENQPHPNFLLGETITSEYNFIEKNSEIPQYAKDLGATSTLEEFAEKVNGSIGIISATDENGNEVDIESLLDEVDENHSHD